MTRHAGVPVLRLTLRIDTENGRWLGPGKVRLLEAIAAHGSIAAAGRTMGMSYRRAWTLVEAIGESLGQPVVTARPGGAGGGGATLTAAGSALVDCYRQLESDAQAATNVTLARLAALIAR